MGFGGIRKHGLIKNNMTINVQLPRRDRKAAIAFVRKAIAEENTRSRTIIQFILAIRAKTRETKTCSQKCEDGGNQEVCGVKLQKGRFWVWTQEASD